MKLPDADWQKRKALRRLLDVLGAPDGLTRFVGGCVRDTLLGLEVSDVDLATRLRPQDVLDRLREAGMKAIPTGLAHGTVTALSDHVPVEVTTLRRDVSTDGRRATVAFTDDWREDAARRDFTINALSADPETRDIADYFGGLADLEARRVRFIGDPLIRIGEDHLRILRFFRFHARFGDGPPDPVSLTACTERASDLMALSRERIADELLKLLALPDPVASVDLMISCGIFRPILPEITRADRLRSLIGAERRAGLVADPIRRLAALLPPDPRQAGAIAARLRLSKRQSKRLVSAADETLDRPDRLAWMVGAEQAIDRLLLAGQAGAEVAALERWERPRLELGGGELIAMGLTPGPIVAATLQAIEREWMERGFPSERETIEGIARRQVDRALDVGSGGDRAGEDQGRRERP